MTLPGGIPLRVRVEFFVIAALLGAGRSMEGMAAWVVVCLVSVVIHECGHAYVAKGLGYRPSIVLWGGGGLTSFARPGEPVPARVDVVVSLAGPAAGFVFGGLALAARPALPLANPLAALALDDFVWVNLVWGAVNLLPVIPLDGSHLAHRALERLDPAGAIRDLRLLSVALCAAAAALAVLWLRWPFAALYAAWLALPSLRGLFVPPARARVAIPVIPHPGAPPPGGGEGATAASPTAGPTATQPVPPTRNDLAR